MTVKERFSFLTLFVFLIAAAAIAQTAPFIASISPEAVYVGSPATTITFTGTGFASGDLICIYGQYGCESVPANYVSPTEFTAQLSSSFFAYVEGLTFYVVTPSDLYSNGVVFDVENLTPVIGFFSPLSVVEGSTPTPITINGTFISGATVQWNGKTIPTTFVNPNQLQFTPPKSDLTKASIVPITVTNPSPGEQSLVTNFDVTYKATVTTVNLPANNIVYDPYAQVIYASVPSSYGPNGNSIAIINPKNGKITGYYYAGSEPHQLALSSDSQYLYVGLNGSGSVQRLILPNFTADIDVSLGISSSGGPNVASGLQVSPSSDHTWAVSTGPTSCCYDNVVYFYSDATQLPDSVANDYYGTYQIIFASSGTLYAYYSNTLTPVTVNSSGGTAGTPWSGVVEGSSIAYADGLIYGNEGEAFNPATGLLLGTYDFGTQECCDYSYAQILPDAPFNRMLALGTTPFLSTLGITSYSLDEFTPQAAASLAQFAGDSESNLISWGSDGVAFLTATENGNENTPLQVVIVTSSNLVAPEGKAKNPKPAPVSLSPSSVTHGGWNFLLAVNGTGFVPGASASWNGTALTTAYVSPTQLNVYVPYTDITSAGTASIVVSNPTPGGGKAAALTFTIN
jgi:trimeric autotransporter adhesin